MLRRVAILATPRSGNTWLRRLLALSFGLSDIAVHRPGDVDWEGLPGAAALQLHWLPDAPFVDLLDRHGFRCVTIRRHPLAVLISILHFAPHEEQTAQWLDGGGGGEEPIHEAHPQSPEFLSYATGPRARALLEVSKAWWPRQGVNRVCYEDLTANPRAEVLRLARELGWDCAAEALEAAIAANRMDAMKWHPNRHYWRGEPHLWKQLLTRASAEAIWRAHRDIFDALGYECDPDPALQAEEAYRNWLAVRE